MADEVKNEVENNEKEETKEVENNENNNDLLEKLKFAGKVALGIGIATGVGFSAYVLGSRAGMRECLEHIKDNFPDVASAIIEADPTFFDVLGG